MYAMLFVDDNAIRVLSRDPVREWCGSWPDPPREGRRRNRGWTDAETCPVRHGSVNVERAP
jgi:hypothetical protein